MQGYCCLSLRCFDVAVKCTNQGARLLQLIVSNCTAVNTTRSTHNPPQVGKALVTTHDFQRAIDYFNKVIRANPGNIGLQHELAQLLIRLRQWPQAAAVLGRCLERLRDAAATAGGVSPADALALEVETWLLTAKVAR